MPEYLRNSWPSPTRARCRCSTARPINRGFDTFQLMDKHNDMRSMLPTMKFEEGRPAFYMLNVGETHYPYAKPDEDSSMWPRISGVNGVFKKLTRWSPGRQPLGRRSRSSSTRTAGRAAPAPDQHGRTSTRAQAYDIVPKDTFITVTADHGELFGEKGYFGHGPIMHEKVFEVPFLEARVR
jgi:hypothetical protein